MRNVSIALVLGAVAVGVAGLLTSGATARAAQFTIEGVATGAEEVPAVTNYPGSAQVRFVFDDAAKTLTFAVTVSGLSPDQVIAAHIHRAPRGVNGPIIHPLSTVGFTQVSGTLNLSDQDIADLRAGNLYFNVHSKDFPGGFARFQLQLPAAAQPAATATPATAVTAPSTGDAGLVEGGPGLSWAFAALAALGVSGLLTLAYARIRR